MAMNFTRGREVYWPLKFHSLEVGPYSVTLTPRAEETYRELAERAHTLLEELFENEFERLLNRYLDRVVQVSEHVNARKSGE
jgi:hypothetical protein